MNTLCVFVHFDRDDRIADYVVHYLEQLQPFASTIIFVSTSALNDNEKAKIAHCAAQIITRPNIGYDFMSWQTGLQAAGPLGNYDEIIIANDSCYAPLFPFAEMFTTMRAQNCDFWGNTASRYITYHLQSYFVVFNKKVISSPVFADFFAGIKVENTKDDVIKNYEIGLSKKLIDAGFTALAYCDINTISKKALLWDKIYFGLIRKIIAVCKQPQKLLLLFQSREIRAQHSMTAINPSIFFYKTYLTRRAPFFKVQLVRDNVLKEKTREVYLNAIENSSSDYDTNLIRDHLNFGE